MTKTETATESPLAHPAARNFHTSEHTKLQTPEVRKLRAGEVADLRTSELP
jgi:hypothetical protein